MKTIKTVFVFMLLALSLSYCAKDSENIAPASFFGVWKYDKETQKVYEINTNKLLSTKTGKDNLYSIEFLKDSTLREVKLDGKIYLSKVGINYPNIYLSHLDSFGYCKIVALSSEKMELEIKEWWEKGLEYRVVNSYYIK